jgi:hypothetical protein
MTVARPLEQSLRDDALGKANRTNQLEVSTNLVDWRAVFNRTGGVQIITGALTNIPARFFRARPR